MPKPQNPEQILYLLKLSTEELGFELITDCFLGRKSLYTVKCRNGHITEKWFNKLFYKAAKCSKCTGLLVTIDDCQKIAKERGGLCISKEYINNITKLTWQCDQNHQWEATWPTIATSKAWCPYCANNNRKTIQNCQQLAKTRKGECLSDSYVNNITKLDWKCKEGHLFKLSWNHAYNYDVWCPICAKTASWAEYEIFLFVKDKFPDAIHKKRKILKNGKFELDIYIPSIQKAIEYDGTYWHSSEYAKLKDERKNLESEEAGIKLLRIAESKYKANKQETLNKILQFLY